MPQWTQAQREAIDARNSELLVSAAAGSGKTAVLVEHVLQLLREGGQINRLLIITFTRAAAAELRERLIAALDAEAAGNAHLRRQMLLARRAQISTRCMCSAIASFASIFRRRTSIPWPRWARIPRWSRFCSARWMKAWRSCASPIPPTRRR